MIRSNSRYRLYFLQTFQIPISGLNISGSIWELMSGSAGRKIWQLKKFKILKNIHNFQPHHITGFPYGSVIKGRFMLKRISGLAIILLISEVHLLSQIKDIGTPFIRNFSKNEYKAGTQNWSVAQDLKGFMYFANNEGLLVFDGVQWELYKLPNFSITRSVYIDNKGDIYIGAYNDLGKMVPGRDGKLTFISLKESIPAEYRNFDDVWSICPYQGKIVFQSYNALYIYEENKPIIVVKARSRIPFAYPVSGRVIVNDEEAGLMELSGTSLIPLSGTEKLKDAADKLNIAI